MLVTVFVFVPASSSRSGGAMSGVMLSAPCSQMRRSRNRRCDRSYGRSWGRSRSSHHPRACFTNGIPFSFLTHCRNCIKFPPLAFRLRSWLGVTCHRFAPRSLATGRLRGRALDRLTGNFELSPPLSSSLLARISIQFHDAFPPPPRPSPTIAPVKHDLFLNHGNCRVQEWFRRSTQKKSRVFLIRTSIYQLQCSTVFNIRIQFSFPTNIFPHKISFWASKRCSLFTALHSVYLDPSLSGYPYWVKFIKWRNTKKYCCGQTLKDFPESVVCVLSVVEFHNFKV